MSKVLSIDRGSQTYMYAHIHCTYTHTHPYLDNRGDELLQEVVPYEVGPVVMDKVDDEALDVEPSWS